MKIKQIKYEYEHEKHLFETKARTNDNINA